MRGFQADKLKPAISEKRVHKEFFVGADMSKKSGEEMGELVVLCVGSE